MRTALRGALPAVAAFLLLFAFQPAHASGSGKVIAVIQGGDGFAIAINNTATVAWAECHENQLVCSSAFAICTGDNEFGVLGNVGLGLKLASVGDAFKHGLPFYTSLPNGGGTATYLTPTGTDPVSGAPLYTAPAGKTIWLVLDQKPAAGYCVGVESFFQIDPEAQKWCVRRKAYNTCGTPVTLLTEKEFYLICDNGIFTTNQHVAQAATSGGGEVAHVFLSILPGLSQTKISAGSVETGQDFQTEFFACSLTGGFSTGQEVGTRWLEMFVDLRPGGSTLKPAGKPGFERFFGHCVELQCTSIPPGSGCVPSCD